ncbi:MAG: hypothetical protein AAF725_27755, partial [Acidobacteriota bacterium]
IRPRFAVLSSDGGWLTEHVLGRWALERGERHAYGEDGIMVVTGLAPALYSIAAGESVARTNIGCSPQFAGSAWRQLAPGGDLELGLN